MGQTVPIRPPRPPRSLSSEDINSQTIERIQNEREDKMDDVSRMDERVQTLLLRDRYRSGSYICYASHRNNDGYDERWVRLEDPTFNGTRTRYRLILPAAAEVLDNFQNDLNYHKDTSIIRRVDSFDASGLARTSIEEIVSVSAFFRTYKSSAKYSLSTRMNSRGDYYSSKTGRTYKATFRKTEEELQQEEIDKLPTLGIQRHKKSFRDKGK